MSFQLFLTSFLHQTTTKNFTPLIGGCCFLLRFYIKPQRNVPTTRNSFGCFLLRFYIKPQRYWSISNQNTVVSYFVFTSNHNVRVSNLNDKEVVSYFVFTSNHNLRGHFACYFFFIGIPAIGKTGFPARKKRNDVYFFISILSKA